MEILKSADCRIRGSLYFLRFLCAARIWWQLSLESLNSWKALGNLNASEVLERGVTLMCVCVCSGSALGWGEGVGDGTTLALLWHYSGTTRVLI